MIALVGYTANAQEEEVITADSVQEETPAPRKAIGLTIKGGLNFNKLKFDNPSSILKIKSAAGYHIGALYEIKAQKYIAIEPGVFFDTRGSKNRFHYDNGSINYDLTTENLVYGLNIPITAKGIFPISEDINLFANVGPYAYIALGGEYDDFDWDENRNRLVGKGRKSLTVGSGDDQIKRVHFGATFGTGVELHRFVFSLSYDLGLNSIESDDVKANAFKLSLGYKL